MDAVTFMLKILYSLFFSFEMFNAVFEAFIGFYGGFQIYHVL
jgi:hypothetical protein